MVLSAVTLRDSAIQPGHQRLGVCVRMTSPLSFQVRSSPRKRSYTHLRVPQAAPHYCLSAGAHTIASRCYQAKLKLEQRGVVGFSTAPRLPGAPPDKQPPGVEKVPAPWHLATGRGQLSPLPGVLWFLLKSRGHPLFVASALAAPTRPPTGPDGCGLHRPRHP